jgi:hypothetical protein
MSILFMDKTATIKSKFNHLKKYYICACYLIFE